MLVLVSGQLHASLFDEAPAAVRVRPMPQLGGGRGELELAEALITRGGLSVSAAVMDEMPKLRLIIKAGSGLDTIDTEAARKRGIRVVASKGSERSVAELCITLTLASLRRLRALDQAVRSGDWTAKTRLLGRGFEGVRIGLVGYGGIAQDVSLLASRLGFEVGFWDRSPDQPEKQAAAAAASAHRFDELLELAQRSDVLSLHLPLTKETRYMIDDEIFSALPSQSILVNTARAELVDPEALERALNNGSLEGAAADVHYQEGVGLLGAPHNHPSVACTPHVGAQTELAHRAVASRVLAILEAYAAETRETRCA